MPQRRTERELVWEVPGWQTERALVLESAVDGPRTERALVGWGQRLVVLLPLRSWVGVSPWGRP
jgi:hypothetical protein